MQTVTELIGIVNESLRAGDYERMQDALSVLLDLYPSDYQDVARILGPIAKLVTA